MTAINIVLQRDRVTLISDTAFYDDGGFVQGFAPKAIAIPHWPAVVAMRGPIFAHALLVAKLSLRFDSLDAFAEEAESWLAEFCEEHYRMICSGGGAAGIQITAAGYSPARGTCRAFSLMSGDLEDVRLHGWDQPEEMEQVDLRSSALVELSLNRAMIQPIPPNEAIEAVGLDPSVNIAALDLAGIRRFGTQVLRAQRQFSGSLDGIEDASHIVGGRPIFMTVSRDGTITTSLGPAWPDKVGERIDPTQDLAEQPAAAPMPGTGHMSRQQRRELERRQRQAAKRSAA